MMNDIFLTIRLFHTSLSSQYRVGQRLFLEKDDDNPYDDEAIKVFDESHLLCGYVANSVDTVLRGTYSAGRYVDSLRETTSCIIRFIHSDFLIVQVS